MTAVSIPYFYQCVVWIVHSVLSTLLGFAVRSMVKLLVVIDNSISHDRLAPATIYVTASTSWLWSGYLGYRQAEDLGVWL